MMPHVIYVYETLQSIGGRLYVICYVTNAQCYVIQDITNWNDVLHKLYITSTVSETVTCCMLR